VALLFRDKLMKSIPCCLLLASLSLLPVQAEELAIAFLPDVHFHDIHGELSVAEADTRSLQSLPSGLLIRTMAAQLHSTRLFNENYFAFQAALNDLATRRVKLVVLPGDFSDDGQAVHLRGLKKLLRNYQQQYGMRFLLTLGNHDPVRPFRSSGGKADFLTANGAPIGVFSPDSSQCLSQHKSAPATPTVLCSEDIAPLGYQGILAELGEFGFYPTANDLYWESPYSHDQTQG